MPASTVSAAIIAGGLARRFSGVDKSRLIVEGRTIIVRQAEILQRVASRILVIGPPRDDHTPLDLTFVPDTIVGAGALGGLYTALVTAPAGRVIVVAGDMPFLHEGVLNLLAERAVGHDAAWVATSRGPEPLLACYQTSIAAPLRSRIDAGHLSIRDLATDLDIVSVGEPDLAAYGPVDHWLTNLNTAADHARVQYPRS